MGKLRVTILAAWISGGFMLLTALIDVFGKGCQSEQIKQLMKENSKISPILIKDNVDSKIQTVINSPNGTQIIAENVILNNASQKQEPKLSANIVYANKEENGKFKTLIKLILDSSSPISKLYIEARALTIQEAKLHHNRSGIDVTGIYKNQAGIAFASLQDAKGSIILELISSKPEKFDIKYTFIN